jgi:SAM-dependent methyltransferase
MEHAVVHDAINAMVGETHPQWPLDWFQSWLQGRRFGRVLSIGCGTGALERDLVQRNLCDRVDAFDGSIVSLLLARNAAAAAGFGGRIRYFSADFNAPALPRHRYDAVFFHQSAHHVAALEKLYSSILRTLKPGRLLYLDEYVGPSRFDWMEDLIAPQQEVFSALPPHVRTTEKLPLPIKIDDPSEAIRSSEIEPQLAVGFRTVARRPYGGNLLSVLFPYLHADQLSDGLVRDLIAQEQQWLANGDGSFYTIIVAQPRRLRAVARAIYWFAPKVKRLLRELGLRRGRLPL